MNDAGATSNAITQAADRFEAARREARIIDLPDNLRPRDLAAGFAVQAELARRAGSVGGWKISYLTFQQQALKGVDRPIAGAIHGPCVLQSPARPGFGFVKPMLECEFAFMLARDLPVRAKPYLRGDVEAAIGTVHPAVEVMDSRLPPMPRMPEHIADALGNGALIVGPGNPDWRALRYGGVAIALSINGAVKARGGAGAVLGGDPIGAVVLMANNPPPGSEGLKRGQIVTTGSCTGMTAVAAGDKVVADFGELGQVEADFAP